MVPAVAQVVTAAVAEVVVTVKAKAQLWQLLLLQPLLSSLAKPSV